jgi:hypothetical protein
MDKLARLKELQQQHKDMGAEIASLRAEIMADLNSTKRPRKKKEQ